LITLPSSAQLAQCVRVHESGTILAQIIKARCDR